MAQSKVTAVTARRACHAVFIRGREVAHESRPSKNENHTEKHFVRNRLFTSSRHGRAVRDPDRPELRSEGVRCARQPIRQLNGCSAGSTGGYGRGSGTRSEGKCPAFERAARGNRARGGDRRGQYLGSDLEPDQRKRN